MDEDVDDYLVVDFNGEPGLLLERLMQPSLERLEVISIVGNAGFGKATLREKICDCRSIQQYFHVGAWVSVSKVYQKRDLLLDILSSFMELSDAVCKMSANNLAEMLYRSLKGVRYLIVLDDMSNIEDWEDIRKSFPNDNNGSRIVLTTWLRDVALHAQPDKRFLLNLMQDVVDIGAIVGDICVGFGGKTRILVERLPRFTLKRLEVISIVGSVGLAKTTLAKKEVEKIMGMEVEILIKRWKVIYGHIKIRNQDTSQSTTTK